MRGLGKVVARYIHKRCAKTLSAWRTLSMLEQWRRSCSCVVRWVGRSVERGGAWRQDGPNLLTMRLQVGSIQERHLARSS
jgi:hypothetical protein